MNLTKAELKEKLNDNDNILSRVFCRECGSKCEPSKALNNTVVTFVDFIGDSDLRGATQSRVGPAELVDCHKCTNCGHSFIL